MPPETVEIRGFTGEVVDRRRDSSIVRMGVDYQKKFGSGLTGEGLIVVYSPIESSGVVNFWSLNHCLRCKTEIPAGKLGAYLLDSVIGSLCQGCGPNWVEMRNRHHREEDQYLNETRTGKPNPTTGDSTAPCGL